MIRARYIELLLVSAFAALLAVQLFVPPSVGLADNGNFGRVYTRFSLAPVRSGQDNFAYFAPLYWFTPDSRWQGGMLSSEMLLAAPPVLLARALGRATFDIRWVGAVHALLFLAAFYALLVYLRPLQPWRRLLLGAAAFWMFGDVAYVSYCNSFYLDAAALAGMLLMVPLALDAAGTRGRREFALLLFAAATLLYIASRPQHAAVGLIPALMVLWVMRRFLLALLLICAVWITVAWTPADYSAKPLFNLIFYKITARSATPQQDLLELGLSADDLRYVGTDSAMPRSPAQDPAWMGNFLHRTNYGKVVRFYLRHPGRTLSILSYDLRLQAFQVRPPGLGNFARDLGLPPGTRTEKFQSWSRIRGALLSRWPWHVALWYLAFLCAALPMARRNPQAAIAAGVAFMAVAEFAIASLADSVETVPHLVLFHALTDITILMAAGWLVTRQSQPDGRNASVERSPRSAVEERQAAVHEAV